LDDPLALGALVSLPRLPSEEAVVTTGCQLEVTTGCQLEGELRTGWEIRFSGRGPSVRSDVGLDHLPGIGDPIEFDALTAPSCSEAHPVQKR
jgi:hypothetical protein